MFLETDGSVAWLYHYPKFLPPLHTMNQCYDKFPILYIGQILFVDPITRQTYPHATTENCSDRIKNLFQLDMNQEGSWYTLTPGIVHQDKPAVFGPQDISPSLLTLSLDHTMRACTIVTSLKDFGIAHLSMPLSEQYLRNSHKILLSTQLTKKGQTVLTITPANRVLCG